MSKCLIAGCGYVGSALAKRLIENGDEVWALRRSPGELPLGVQEIRADLCDSAGIENLPAELDFVFYTAAPDSHEEGSYQQVYLVGLEKLTTAVRNTSPRLAGFLLTSSTSVYGQSQGEWVDETSPTKPLSFAGSTVLAGEKIALSSGLPAIVVRFGGIYGPGRTNLLDGVKSGSLTPSMNEAHYTNRIHRDDCAAVLEFLCKNGRFGETYNGVDNDPADRNDVIQWLANQIAVISNKDLPSSSQRRRPGNKRCRNDKLVSLGYTFIYPTFREGYANLIASSPRN